MGFFIFRCDYSMGKTTKQAGFLVNGNHFNSLNQQLNSMFLLRLNPKDTFDVL